MRILAGQVDIPLGKDCCFVIHEMAVSEVSHCIDCMNLRAVSGRRLRLATSHGKSR